MIRILMLLAVLSVWAFSVLPAHAQQRRGGAGASGGNGLRNTTGQPSSMAPTGPAPLGGSSMGGFQNGGLSGIGGINRLDNGGLSNAFGDPPQYQQTLGAPIPGRPYQIPSQYANNAPGTVITWGRYRYQLGSDGTMTSAGPIPGQPYQIPAEYANQAPGTVITKGRYRYLLGNDGTMTAYVGPEPRQTGAETQRPSTGPIPGERYQIPAEHANAAPGAVLTYHGNNYVANKDGTMTALASPP
ncbi:hypothetical protein [Singulisphaera acidiphila]|nr:hypothetical protein [Singulisphaera acidiphila]